MCSFRFENNKDAANWNSEVIKSYDNDFAKAIEGNKNTIVAPGSEFRALNRIERIWKYRENWEAIKEILTKGFVYPLKEPQNEKIRLQDLEASIAHGNHKSCAKSHLENPLTKTSQRNSAEDT